MYFISSILSYKKVSLGQTTVVIETLKYKWLHLPPTFYYWKQEESYISYMHIRESLNHFYFFFAKLCCFQANYISLSELI